MQSDGVAKRSTKRLVNMTTHTSFPSSVVTKLCEDALDEIPSYDVSDRKRRIKLIMRMMECSNAGKIYLSVEDFELIGG